MKQKRGFLKSLMFSHTLPRLPPLASRLYEIRQKACERKMSLKEAKSDSWGDSSYKRVPMCPRKPKFRPCFQSVVESKGVTQEK